MASRCHNCEACIVAQRKIKTLAECSVTKALQRLSYATTDNVMKFARFTLHARDISMCYLLLFFCIKLKTLQRLCLCVYVSTKTQRPQSLTVCLKPDFAKVSKISGDPALLQLTQFDETVTWMTRLIVSSDSTARALPSVYGYSFTPNVAFLTCSQRRVSQIDTLIALIMLISADPLS